MRILLDTHLLLWAIAEPGKLKLRVQRALRDDANEILFSAVNIWEVAIKSAAKRQAFSYDPAVILATAVETGFVELPVRAAAALKVADLPPHHGDPFDRLLVAQAMTEPCLFYTADAKLSAYGELVVQV